MYSVRSISQDPTKYFLIYFKNAFIDFDLWYFGELELVIKDLKLNNLDFNIIINYSIFNFVN